MSKYLVKILSLCALVVLLCVTVVGAAVFVTEAVGCTLTIAEVADKVGDWDGADGGLEIRIDNEVVKDKDGKPAKKITVSKYTEIEVVYKKSTGYNFKGWFKNQYTSKDKPASDREAYKFEIKDKNLKLTAVKNVKTYNVTYTGFMDDEKTTVEQEYPSISNTYEYNQELAQISAIDSNIHFGNWYLSDEEKNPISATPYARATFDVEDENVFLTPVWDNQMVVTYVDAKDTVIKSEKVSKANVGEYKLLTGEQVAANVRAGYEFDGWVDAGKGTNDKVTSITFDVNGIKLRMAEKLINYTVNVKFNEISSNTTSLTYTVDKGDNLAYTANRANYTLVHALFDGKEYKYENGAFTNLGKDIVEKGDKTVNITLVWDCDFDSITFNFVGYSYYMDESLGFASGWQVYSNNNPVKILKEIVTFQDKSEAGYYDLTDDIYSTYMNQFTNPQTDEGRSVHFNGQVYISIDGTNYSTDYMLQNKGEGYTVTFADVITFLQSEGLLDTVYSGGHQVTVIFMYE